VALARWCRHLRLLTDDISMTLSVHQGQATLAIAEQRALGPLREFCLVSNLRFVQGYACWLIDSRIALRAASFPFAAPPHQEAYGLMFPGQLQFGAAQASCSFDARYLALPPQRDEAALRTMLKRALPLTVLQYRHQRDQRDRLLGQRVRELLRSRPLQAGNAQALAALLHISNRSLHRQLAQEGLSLQALKDEVRHAQASELLRRSRKPIKQIALAVGFRNEKSFARAFRGWSGLAPGAFRQQTSAPGA
jgi:AraC-like DNA-binding protein